MRIIPKVFLSPLSALKVKEKLVKQADVVGSIDAKALSDFLKNVILKDGNHTEVIMNATK